MRKVHTILILNAMLLCKTFSNPTEPTVASGTASFEILDPQILQISVSDQTIIDWKEFSIGAGESTRFLQPSSQSTVMNRVLSDQPSQIMGLLEANGKVLLINPNGILVDKTGIINTGSFIASTLDLLNASFLENKELVFKGDSQASIVHLGTIHAIDGDVTLLGKFVENKGIIEAPNGTGAIVAASEILLSTEGAQKFLIRPKITSSKEGTGLLNEGSIQAVQVELKADGNPYAIAIQHTGSAAALGIENKDGRLFIVAEKGTAELTGTVKSENKSGKGGEAYILAETIYLKDNASIDASGKTGGGKILIGGDERGSNPDIYQAKYLYADGMTQVTASALNDGDGGKIIAWATDITSYLGSIESKGGAYSGNGGFVEVSSPGKLAFQAQVDTAAVNGKIGTLLLDPTQIDITGATSNVGLGNCGFSAATYAANMITGTLDVGTLQTDLMTTTITITTFDGTCGPFIGNGSITFTNPLTILAGSTGSLILDAYGDIIINANITNSSATSAITMNAGQGMMGGDITLANTATLTMDAVVTGATTLNAFGNIDISGNIFNNSTAANIAMTAGAFSGAGSIIIQGPISFSGSTTANLLLTANSGMAGNDDIAITSAITINQGGLVLSTPNDIHITSNITVTGPITVQGLMPMTPCGTLFLDATAGGVNASLINNLAAADTNIRATYVDLQASASMVVGGNANLQTAGNLTIIADKDISITGGMGTVMIGAGSTVSCLGGVGKTLIATAENITLLGGGRTNSLAGLQSANTATITTTANGITASGNFSLLGAVGPALAGSNSSMSVAVGGDLILTAGSASNGAVVLSSSSILTINYDGAFLMDGGWFTEIVSGAGIVITGTGTYGQGMIPPGNISMSPGTDGAALMAIDGTGTLSINIPGNLTIAGSGGAPGIPATGILGPVTVPGTVLIDLTIGGNISLTGGASAGYTALIGSPQFLGVGTGDTSVNITASGSQGITLNGGSANGALAVIGSLGGAMADSVTLQAPNGSITLNGSLSGVMGAGALISSNSGATNLTSKNNIVLNGTANNLASISMTPFMVGAMSSLQAIAGNSISLNDYASIDSTQDILLVIDNNTPQPGIGMATFSTGALSTISANSGLGDIQIFTTIPSLVAISGTLNGAPFVQGPVGIDTDQERYNVFYPNGFVNPNPPFFTVFYKGESIPPVPPTPGEITQTLAFIQVAQLGMQEFLTDLQAYLDFDFFNFSELFFTIALDNPPFRSLTIAPFPPTSMFSIKKSDIKMFRREYTNYNLRRINLLK